MSGPRRLVFHIGLEKTGSTSLQACLYRNPAILRRHAILYPSRNSAFGYENHKPLVGCYEIDAIGDKWLEIDPSRRKATVASLVREIEGAPERTAVVSAEHFSSRFGEPQIEALRDDFERFDCRVMIVVRDHLSRFCSAYTTYVANGGNLPLEDFADGAMRPGAYGLLYADLIACWMRVFGRDRVELIGYGKDVVRRVLARLAPGLGEEPNLGDFRLRVSPSADAVTALRLANAHGPMPEPFAPMTIAWTREARKRQHIDAWLRRCVGDGPAYALAVDRERLRRLTALAASDAARLEAACGFVLDAPESVPLVEGDNYHEAAILLAKVLAAKEGKPWTGASLIGTGLGIFATLRNTLASLRHKRRRLARLSSTPVGSAPSPRR